MSGVIVPFYYIIVSDSPGEGRLGMEKMLVEYVDPIDGKIRKDWIADSVELEELIAEFIKIGRNPLDQWPLKRRK